MKKYILIAAVLTLSLAACTGTKRTASTDSNPDTTLASANTETQKDANTEAHQDANTETATETTAMIENASGDMANRANGSSGAMNNVQATDDTYNTSPDYGDMFTELEMTDDQIDSFRSAMEDFKNKQQNTPNGEMLGSMESERTRQLETILSEDQFSKYQKWEADNK